MAFSKEQAKVNLHKASTLAASSLPGDHEQLFGLLNSKAFLFSVEPEANYNLVAPKRLQVARVIGTLMKNPHKIAWDTLVRLIKAPDFISLEQLSDLLIIALVVVRPLPPLAIAFLEKQSAPDSAALHLVMITLASNQSDPALRLFEHIIADAKYETETRTIWLRVEYLTRRNDVPILRSYEKMIVEGVVPLELRLIALESLCSYDPKWYLACTKPQPPLRLFASSEAKVILRKILTFAKQGLDLSPELKLAVDTTEIEIGDK